MQRHFSNRGEAHAEVTAARMLAGKRGFEKVALRRQLERGGSAQQWLSQATEKPHRAKKPQLKLSKEEFATL
jgi:hypothetical protein